MAAVEDVSWVGVVVVRAGGQAGGGLEREDCGNQSGSLDGVHSLLHDEETCWWNSVSVWRNDGQNLCSGKSRNSVRKWNRQTSVDEGVSPYYRSGREAVGVGPL